MKSICFYFQVHQPLRLRKYRFFDIGKDHNYYDDFQNDYIMKRVGERSYLPMNQILLDLINEYGTQFKVSFSISGLALDQFEMYCPEVLDSFKKLSDTGSVEFLAETYSHSLSSLKSKKEFTKQVNDHKTKIKNLFGQTPKTFRNTELIYSDEVGAMVADMGFKTMLTEGAKHVLGWKSPNFIYTNTINPKLKLLLKNFRLSDDIAFRFSERSWEDWPLTAEKYFDWLNQMTPEEQVINLFMDYETFGEHQWEETGIFDFFKSLPAEVFKNSNFQFNTPSEVSKMYQPVAKLQVPYPISWADEERDLTAWLGNELQDEAFDKLYQLEPLIVGCKDENILKDWKYLQSSDHFYYMCTKWFSDGDVHKYFNPYRSPYDAFINFMNVLADFEIRVREYSDTNKSSKRDKLPLTVNVSEGDNLPSPIVKSKKTKKPQIVKNIKSKKPAKVEKESTVFLIESLTGIADKKLKKFLTKVDDITLIYSVFNGSDKLLKKVKKNISKSLAKKLDKFNPKKEGISNNLINNAKQRMRYRINKYL